MSPSADKRSSRSCSICHAPYTTERFCPLDGGAIVDDREDASDPLIGRTIDDRYFVRRLIGRGGMGVVYEADHVGLDKRVAIKFLSGGDTDKDALARFRREARAASRIVHEHIIQIYDVGTDATSGDFIVMEYVEGRDLRQVLEAGPLDPDRAVEIARQILQGLHAIHGAGIVHRDIKPANVLLATRDDKVDFVKIMDFGISKAVHHDTPGITDTGRVVGTPEYMAPEQLTGDPLDRRTDLYAVGLTLFEMLVGRTAFQGPTLDRLATQLREGPPSLDTLRPGLPPTLVAAVARALDKSPARRFDDAIGFANALGDAKSPDPTKPSAKPRTGTRETVAERLPRRLAEPSKRARWVWLVGIAVVAVAGLVLGIAIGLGGGDRSPAATRDASLATKSADQLALARAAEASGKLELAIAAYLEAYDNAPSPEVLFRIGELDERLGRTQDAASYFQRYLDTSPAATDREAVTARIARLRPPPMATPSVDAAVSAPKPPHVDRTLGSPRPAKCHCVRDDRKVWLCTTKMKPLCRCNDEDGWALCKTPFTCTTDCEHYETARCGDDTKADPDFANFTVPATAKTPCEGYRQPDVLAPKKLSGKWVCSVCNQSTYGYEGANGAACVGYEGRDGERLDGRLECP